MSGMYDLAPVRLSWRSKYLKLTDATVDALSPQRDVDRISW
jgi:arylformamidase